MPNIFFTSDTHYHHKNIVRGCTTWTELERCRDFDTLEEHDETLVQNINAVVKENDILYHLGDWSFGGLPQIFIFREKLHCKNIHLVLGNHDHHIASNRTNPVTLVNARQLFVSVNQLIMNEKIGGKSMCLSHFAQRVWDDAQHGNWNLYGHSHGSLPEYEEFKHEVGYLGPQYKLPRGEFTGKYFKAIDVGIDTHPNFQPYAFEEIAQIMLTRINLRVDHHNENTN